jgi:hypothetical protein
VTSSGTEDAKMPTIGVFGDTVMDGQRTVFTRHAPPVIDIVEIDDKSPRNNDYEFDTKKILRTGDKISKSVGETWHGRKVDRFEVNTIYRNNGKMETLEQTVIADVETHLPLHVEEFRDNHSWGDIWEYQYGRPDESNFEIKISPKAEVHDLRKERVEVASSLKTGAVFVNYGQTAHVLFPYTQERAQPVLPVKVDGSSARPQAHLRIKPKLGVPEATLFRINGKEWELAQFVGLPADDAKNFAPFKGNRVSLKVGNHRLVDVPVFHFISAWTLLRPFNKE